MYAISNDYKNLVENSLSLSPKSKIVVDNVEYSGTFLKTYPKISHKTSLMIGGFPTKTCSFEIYNINNNLDFEGKEITVYRGLDINGTTEWIPQGIFIATSDKITTNISTKTISFNNIQDKSQLFDKAYFSNLSWENNSTHTGLEIVQEICNNLGVALEITTFNWYNYNFKQPNFKSNTTYREVISRLAEIGGCIACISRTGGLIIKSQNIAENSISRKRYGKLTKEKKFGNINVIVLGKNGIDDDIVYPNPQPTNIIEWKINDNPFVDLYREEMIEKVANYIIGQSIIPFELIDFVDGFYLDLNDVIQVSDKNNNIFDAVILNYESTSRIKSSIGAETQNKSISNYNLAGSNKTTINDLRLEADYNKNQIQAVVNEQSNQSAQLSQLQITDNMITQQVSSMQTIVDETNANIMQIENQVQQTITDSNAQFEVINSTLENGVEKLKNNLVTIDINGINVQFNDENFKTLMTNKNFVVKDGTKEIAFFGYDDSLQKTIARIKELETERITAGYHRCEPFTDGLEDRTGWFYVGGVD